MTPVITEDFGPKRVLGQAITFQYDRLDRSSKTVHATAAQNTVKKIAAHNGGIKNARAIADYNSIVSVLSKLKSGREIKLPGQIVKTTKVNLDVLAGDSPPRVVGGYAKWEGVDRAGRAGILQFSGYDPITMEIPLRFESTGFGGEFGRDRLSVEDDIEALEQMGGRGNFPGATTGAPGHVHITVTGAGGDTVPLVPSILQTDGKRNRNPPLWVVTGIDWDDSVPDGVLRNKLGNRVRQKCVVTVQQYVVARIIAS